MLEFVFSIAQNDYFENVSERYGGCPKTFRKIEKFFLDRARIEKKEYERSGFKLGGKSVQVGIDLY